MHCVFLSKKRKNIPLKLKKKERNSSGFNRQKIKSEKAQKAQQETVKHQVTAEKKEEERIVGSFQAKDLQEEIKREL